MVSPFGVYIKNKSETRESAMKTTKFHLYCLLVAVVFFSVLSAGKSHAALTKQLSYQGRLQNASGQPVANGTYSVVFSIYNVSTGGSVLWMETQNVSVESGGFSAYLGSVTPLTLPFNEDYYLGIKVGSDPEMTPRLKLAIVGTSAFAFEAGKLEGKVASDFALATHTHTVDATTVQRRVSGACIGQVMVAINQDGTVTCEADDAGGGGGGTPASTVTSVGASNVVGTLTNYAREDHQHSLPANFITDAMVSNTANIATSKLSGTVTAISGHGLGSLATLNAVSSASIQDATITFADIAPNGCTSGQIVEYNGSAWICGTDDVGGGGGVITNPTSTQTIIAGNATTTPLALKSASAPTVAMFDVQDAVGGSVVKVAPSGNLLVGNPAQIAPKLSVEDTSINPGIAVQQKGTGTALDVWQSGTSGSAGVFSITNAVNASDLISGDLSGTGNLLKLSLSGINKFVVDKVGNVTATSFSGSGSSLTGVSASDPNAVKTNPSALQTIQPTADIVPLIIKDDAGGAANLFDIQNNGGTSLVKVIPTGNLLVGNPTATTPKVSAEETGTANNAGRFQINNAANAAAALVAGTNGTGPTVYAAATGTGNAVYGYVTGTGVAGYFYIQNATNAASVLKGDTTGTGSLLQLQQGGVDKFVVDNTGAITVGGAANAVKTNPSALQTIQPTADVVPLIIKDDAAATANLFDIQTNAGASLVKVNPLGNLLVGNPASTTAKVSVEDTGTSNNAGRFQINNAGNANSAVYGTTNGTGAAVYGFQTGADAAGKFEIVNVANTGSAVIGNTTGTGYAGYFQIINAANASSAVIGDTNGTGPAIKGYTTGTGAAGNFSVANVTNTSPIIYGNTTSAQATAHLIQLQQNSGDQFVVNNSGNVLVGNPTTTTAKVSAEETGTGNSGGYFKISNAGNTNDALYGQSAGSGAGVFGYAAGTGKAVYGYVASTGGYAGFFDTQNASNTVPVIYGNTTSTQASAYLIQLQKSYSNKFVVDNTGNILLDGNANPSIKASGATPNLILDADGTGASIVKVKNTTSPGNVLFQTEGAITAFNGTNSVPVTGATQQLIQTGNTCESLAGDQTITLSFSPAFAAAPKVVATGTTATAGAGFVSSVSGATTAGATVNLGGTQTGTVECVDWIAVGNK